MRHYDEDDDDETCSGLLCDSISRALIGIWKMKQAGFFDVEERLARLSGLGDQLEAFSRTVDFEVFRPELEKALVDL